MKMNLRFSILCFFISSFSILPFTPGKWSYTDQFLFQKSKQGPSKEIVKNTEGKVVFTANYEYDSDGRLKTEIYFLGDGSPDGKREFDYKNGQIFQERGYDSNGVLFEKKEFYFKNGLLKKLHVSDAEAKPIITYSLDTSKEGLVTFCEGKNYLTGDIESFRVEADPKNPNGLVQTLNDDKRRKVGEILLRFDSKKLLLEREFFQGDIQRKSKMEYDNEGKLIQYTFHVKQGETWILEKAHQLVYK